MNTCYIFEKKEKEGERDSLLLILHLAARGCDIRSLCSHLENRREHLSTSNALGGGAGKWGHPGSWRALMNL